MFKRKKGLYCYRQKERSLLILFSLLMTCSVILTFSACASGPAAPSVVPQRDHSPVIEEAPSIAPRVADSPAIEHIRPKHDGQITNVVTIPATRWYRGAKGVKVQWDWRGHLNSPADVQLRGPLYETIATGWTGNSVGWNVPEKFPFGTYRVRVQSSANPANYAETEIRIEDYFLDLTISDMSARVQSMEMQPGTTSFQDNVKVEVTVKNIGSANLPTGTVVALLLTRDGQRLINIMAPTTINNPGGSWTYSYMDRFPHGAPSNNHIYKATVSANITESKNDNNEKSLSLSETTLHPHADVDLQMMSFDCPKIVTTPGTAVAEWDCSMKMLNNTSAFPYGNGFINVKRVDNGQYIGPAVPLLFIDQNDMPGPKETKEYKFGFHWLNIPHGTYDVNGIFNEIKSANTVTIVN